MLSVVLYGRNDSHGYNLHKRAAISLNAIAELLTDADDEILFVDYNTPDDLPTFPEAIADTLSPKAVDRLRILRVRAGVHRERFAARTHLAALEPIARNAAIRRCNPANRWVLSTNTDMVFCPRRTGDTLTSIVAGLEDGFYHLPRFELPEGLWETLDRKDGPGIIAAARDWGARWHLNEIVFADRDNVYDAPGDFQLFLRQDLFDIGGFHEDMILGWHLDANMAKRMRLLRGKVSSALDHLFGYHCDHTRLASEYHKADRVENDQVRFDDQVIEARVPQQMAGWGLADIALEELRLGRASHARYLAAVEAAVPTGQSAMLETQYKRIDYGRLDYPADHVLPYLLDVASCVPQDTRIAYVGARPDTFGKFLRGWTAMGGAAPIVLAEAGWLTEAEPSAQRLPLAEWVEAADMFVFEVGAEQAVRHADLTPQESARLWTVDNAFRATADREAERRAKGAPSRRAVVINGVHNFFEPQMMVEAAVTLTPYSSRVRQGFFADRSLARRKAATAAGKAAMADLGALEPLSDSEVAWLEGLLDQARAAEDGAPVWRDLGRVGAELAACISAGLIDPGPEAQGVLLRAAAARLSRSIEGTEGVVHPDAGRKAASRLVRLEDWDDPEWVRLARRLFSNRDHAALFNRDVWIWERVCLAQNLLTALRADAGASVLVAGRQAEPLAFSLARLGFRVDIADPTALAAGELKAADWRAEYAFEGWVSPEPVGLIEARAQAIADGFRYDAVLLPQNALFAGGRAASGDMLAGLTALLRPGGHLGLTFLTQPLPRDERLQEHALPYALTADGVFPTAVSRFVRLEPLGDCDVRLTPRTFDRLAPMGDEASAIPGLVRGEPPAVEALAVMAFTRREGEDDWEALRAIMAAGVFGQVGEAAANAARAAASRQFTPQDLAAAPAAEQAGARGSYFGFLAPLSGLTRTPIALRVPAGFGPCLAAAAPLGRIPAGGYELEVEALIVRPAEGPSLAVAVVCHGRVVAEDVLDGKEPGSRRLYIPFNIADEGWRGVSVLFKSLGRAEFEILTLVLH